MTVLLVAACAAVIGVSLGLLGAGGSILTVPLLSYVAGRPPREAIATSLVAVATTAAVATVVHARAGRVRWRTGLAFGSAGMIGAFAAGRLSVYLPERMLMLLFGLMMATAALAMLRGRRDRSGDGEPAAPTLAVVGAQGAAVGSLTGLVGAGGGFIIVPALNVLIRIPIHVAVGTSLMVITMNASASLVAHLGHATIDPRLAAAVTGAMVVGSLVGGQLTARVAPARLRIGFGYFVIAVALFVLAKQL